MRLLASTCMRMKSTRMLIGLSMTDDTIMLAGMIPRMNTSMKLFRTPRRVGLIRRYRYCVCPRCSGSPSLSWPSAACG